ncbi:MAG: histidinol-phosphate transaminase [Thermoleophilaceae bacterium]|nr:histidinol-phosphate transaminase [Thermoleophilaceae bacterium]
MPLRDALAKVDPYRPARPMAELQATLGLERIVKLSSNEGAFGPLPAAVAAFEAAVASLNRYPDGGGVPLREALAERHGVAPEQVVLGNGADELIRLCAVATLDPGDAAAYPWPSFPSYRTAARCGGAEPIAVPLSGRAPDLDGLLAAARGPRTKLVYLANPNNPTGAVVEGLRGFVAELPGGVLCVLDEAYAEYADPEPEGPQLLREGAERLCVLRTFSKVYGLAALRVGYALASPDVADALDRVRPIFNVNQPAQEAALASLGEGEAIALRIGHARRARLALFETLAAAGLDPEPSQANFVYADVPDGDGAALARRLLEEEGVLVRELPGFGAPAGIRVTVGTDEENELFAAALGRVLTRSRGRSVPPV